MQDKRVLRPVNDAMLNDRFVTAGKEVCNLHLHGKNDAVPVHNIKAHGELEVYRHPFLYPSLDGGKFSALRFGCLTTEPLVPTKYEVYTHIKI